MIWKITGKDRLSVHFCTFGLSLFHFSQVSELLNKVENIDSMNNKTSSDVAKRRITRESEKKKKEEEDLKKKTKFAMLFGQGWRRRK